MFLNAKEMEILCIFHSGTIAETLALLHKAENESHGKIELIKIVAEKLDNIEENDTISLAFELES